MLNSIIIFNAVMGISGHITCFQRAAGSCKGGRHEAFLTPEHPERAAAAVTGIKRAFI